MSNATSAGFMASPGYGDQIGLSNEHSDGCPDSLKMSPDELNENVPF